MPNEITGLLLTAYKTQGKTPNTTNNAQIYIHSPTNLTRYPTPQKPKIEIEEEREKDR